MDVDGSVIVVLDMISDCTTKMPVAMKKATMPNKGNLLKLKNIKDGLCNRNIQLG